MQPTGKDEKPLPLAPADPESQPLPPIPIAQVNENDDDPDEIFIRAVTEIDTQPLPRRTSATISDILQTVFCVSLLFVACAGIVWQAIMYPHTLVILYAREKPASVTTTLAVPTHTLAPVTVTRTATTITTGEGHQEARAASGILTFYNGNASPQTIAIGTVFTASDGIQASTSEAVTIPAAVPPYLGQATVTATTLQTGSRGNIHAYDINGTASSSVFVKNLEAFTGGRDQRTYQAVAPQDLQTLTSTVNEAVTQAFTNAFPIRQGEEAVPTKCHTTTSANHQVGVEAQNVTLTASKTCSAVAYNSQELTRQATAAFTQTKPATNYHVIGVVQTTLRRVSPFLVAISGKWAYTFSLDYEQLLAQKIAGDSPAMAKAYLLSTGVIAQASIPNALPPAMYINFLVLVG